MPQKLRPSYKFNEEKLQQLKQIVPEAFKDGMLDYNSLYDALSDYNEEDNIEIDDNFYGLYWPGKRKAKRTASIPPRGTLIPVKGDGVDEENTKNIYIEGDNLEVLKILQKSYAGKIKMIYIDPPYNTGNDFVYNDDFSETAEAYGKATGQIDDQGVKQTTNSRADGRFHSKWLNMMYPRLKLAHSLLSEDGVIFISIDDNEVAQLRKICDEIFGEENFVECIIWKKRTTPPNDRSIGRIHEFILLYCKNFGMEQLGLLPRQGNAMARYNNPDNDQRGAWVASDLSANGKGGRLVQSCIFPIRNPNNGNNYLPPEGKCWLFNRDKVEKWIKEGRISFREKTGTPFLKRYLSEVRPGVTLPTIMTEYGNSQTSTAEFDNLLEKKGVFEYTKPTTLLKALMQVGAPKSDSIILDFFSGSATTAHAVMKLNDEDGGNRQFIMVQLPEKCDEKSEAYKAGYKNICEIGKERIRRAGKKISENQNSASSASSRLCENSLDIGFKVYRTSSSNYKKWQNYTGIDIKEAEDLFAQYENPLIDNWKEENLLTEIMLNEGFLLNSTITVIKDFKKNKVTQISSDFCEHSLFICLDKSIHAETINTLSLGGHDIFICLDNAVNDQDKARLDDKGLIKTI